MRNMSRAWPATLAAAAPVIGSALPTKDGRWRNAAAESACVVDNSMDRCLAGHQRRHQRGPRSPAVWTSLPTTCATSIPAVCQADYFLKPAGHEHEFQKKYEVQEEIGSGGFGTVVRAVHKPTGQLCAIKRVGMESVSRAMENSKMRGASLGEADVLGSLNHPNIVGMYEYYTTDRELLLVQELCHGESLQALGPLSREEARAAVVFKQILEAILHCHERGFVHRDLKLNNFIFASTEPKAALKLIDFGLSSKCLPDECLRCLAGTVEHSSPESLCTGHGCGYGLAADMWAVGAVFFQLLTGEPLIQVDRPKIPSEELRRMLNAKVAERICDARYIRIRLIYARTFCPASACDLVERLLNMNPSARISAADALKHPFICNSLEADSANHGS